MFYKLKKDALRLRKKCIKNGIPDAFLKVADSYFERALKHRKFAREHKLNKYKNYGRAFNYVIVAQDIYAAFLYPNRYTFPNVLLNQEVNK